MVPNPFLSGRRIALVTGGSRGIGKMIASGFIGQGAKVYISSRKADVCEAVAESWTQLHCGAAGHFHSRRLQGTGGNHGGARRQHRHSGQ